MAERKIHLSSAQQLEFTSVSESITDDELEFYYTLTAEDIQIINTHRGQDNRLGFAMTLCCLRHKGWPYPVLDSVPLKVLNFVSAQIDVDPVVIQGYGRNKNTKSNHLLEICSYYGYRQEDAWGEVTDFIRCCSHRLNDLVAITKETVQFSKEHRIIPDQMQRASCLNILINTVVIWNTVYLQKAIEYKKENGGLDESLLTHISPLNWNHIQLYGRYYYKAESSLDKNQFRQLRVFSDEENLLQEEE